MVSLAVLPVLVVGLATAVTSVVLARRAENQLVDARASLLDETIGQSRADQADDMLARLHDFIDDRFDDVIDWSRAEPVVRQAGAQRPEIAQYIDAPVDAVEADFDGADLLDASGASSAYLRTELTDRPVYAEVFFTDENGFNVGATNPTSDFVQSDEQWWQDAWANGAFLGPLEFDESAGVRSFELAVRIDDRATGRPLGVIKAVVDATSVYTIADEFADLRENQSRNVRVVSLDGELLAETASGHDPGRVGTTPNFDTAQTAAFALAANADRSSGFLVSGNTVFGFGRTDSVRRVPRLGVMVDNHRWIVFIEQPEQVAVAPLASVDELGAGLERSAFLTIILVSSLIMATAALAAGLSRLLAQRILSPIDLLRSSASRMSDEDLPALVERLRQPGRSEHAPVLEPIQLDDAHDEIADLAEAFNSVSFTAAHLAAGQAVGRSRDVESLLVNLGRRNQQLVSRQLQVIDDLERHERDPHTLQGLFQVDLLAARMRRNAESLLVLSGQQTPSTSRTPTSIEDVVRAAISEVESFTRAKIGHLDSVHVHPLVARDLTHLLAELFENAIRFSPPDTDVEIVGMSDADDSYTLAVTDHGLAMTRDELEEANRRLVEPTYHDEAPTSRLGLYVVGSLAARHGIDVRLVESPTVGLTAKLTLPRTCLSPAPLKQTAEANHAGSRRPPSVGLDESYAEPYWPPPRVDTAEPLGSSDEQAGSADRHDEPPMRVRVRTRKAPDPLITAPNPSPAAHDEIDPPHDPRVSKSGPETTQLPDTELVERRASLVRDQVSGFTAGAQSGHRVGKAESAATEQTPKGAEDLDTSSATRESGPSDPSWEGRQQT